MDMIPSVPQDVSRSQWARLTRFQQQVYAAVCRIPKGQTRSYQWVAQEIRRPRATRAVGNALHANPFAPTVPCHRVVRSDGSLGGFARGAAAKRRLLAAERRFRYQTEDRRTLSYSLFFKPELFHNQRGR